MISNECYYCGGSEGVESKREPFLATHKKGEEELCQYCNESMEDKTLEQWLHWLKRNDPEHWQKLVNKHRLEKSQIAHRIRRVRIA